MKLYKPFRGVSGVDVSCHSKCHVWYKVQHVLGRIVLFWILLVGGISTKFQHQHRLMTYLWPEPTVPWCPLNPRCISQSQPAMNNNMAIHGTANLSSHVARFAHK